MNYLFLSMSTFIMTSLRGLVLVVAMVGGLGSSTLGTVSLVEKMTVILESDSGKVGFVLFMDCCVGLFECYKKTGQYPTFAMLDNVMELQMKDTNAIGMARRDRWIRFLNENPYLWRYFMESAFDGIRMYEEEKYEEFNTCVIEVANEIIHRWEKIAGKA